MATYRQIAGVAREIGGSAVKTCWIAHVMADYGLTTRVAPNRISLTERKYPCPEGKRAVILKAMRRLGMLGGDSRRP